MKLERRGKFAGVKLHLTAKECQDILSFKQNVMYYIPLYIQKDMGNLIKKAITKDPTILVKRTPEQIKEALENEQEKSEARLSALDEYLDKISGY